MHVVLNMSSIVCFPSYREGLPKALLEAASCEIPIVAFDVPGCREVVVDGKNGFLVSFGDVKALADSVCKLICDHDMCVSFGKAGRSLVVREFSDEMVASETALIWSALCVDKQGLSQ